MIGIHDDARIFKTALRVQIGKFAQVLVMIVGDSLPVFVHRASQYCVSKRIAC